MRRLRLPGLGVVLGLLVGLIWHTGSSSPGRLPSRPFPAEFFAAKKVPARSGTRIPIPVLSLNKYRLEATRWRGPSGPLWIPREFAADLDSEELTCALALERYPQWDLTHTDCEIAAIRSVVMGRVGALQELASSGAEAPFDSRIDGICGELAALRTALQRFAELVEAEGSTWEGSPRWSSDGLELMRMTEGVRWVAELCGS